MIIGHLNHLERFRQVSNHMNKAIDYLMTQDWQSLPDGRYEPVDDSFYLMVSHYQTKTADSLSYEAHNNYLDIQIVLAGEEGMGFAEHQGLENLVPYDAQRDISFWACPEGDRTIIPLFPGRIVVLFPEDAHAPCISLGIEPSQMHKVVLKVLCRD